MKNIFVIFVTSLFILISSLGLCEEIITRKELFGRLISVSPLAEPIYIGIEIMSEEGFLNRENHLYLKPGYRIIGRNFFNEIKIGDVLTIGYDEVKVTMSNIPETIKNFVKTIEFMRSGKDVLGRQKVREISLE